jgi:signal transduction histidine kinase
VVSCSTILPHRRLGVWVIMSVIILALTSGCMASTPAIPAPKAEEGVIDLTDWLWDKDGIVPLDGQWKFTGLRSAEAGKSAQSELISSLEVPGTWGKLRMGNGLPTKAKGIGIYELMIRHQPQKGTMAIHLPNISTAYELSINDNLVLSRGHVDQTRIRATPYQLPADVYFQAVGSETKLKLVVGNSDHRSGGIRTEIVMGNAENIQKRQVRNAAKELIILGSLLMIGFYHLGLFILRRKEFANILFALLCLFVSLRMGVIGESFILQGLPWLTWGMAIRIEYIALIMSGWCGYSYFRMMYPQEMKKIGFKLPSVVGALLILSILMFPPSIFTSWILSYQIYILLLSARILTGLALAIYRKREGAWLALWGMAGMVLTIVNDMLFYNGWWSSIDLVPFGLLFLIVMNSFIISLRFSMTYDRAEQMSAELVHWNSSLEEKITERTEELQRSYVTLEDAKMELEKMEHSRMQLVSNISHDLRTPITLLQGYLEALRDHVISEPEQRDSVIRLMHTKVEGLNSLIQDLFDLSVLEARKVVLNREEITLTCWKERLIELYTLEMQQKDIRFECKLVNEVKGNAVITIDIHRMDRVFANLLNNAIRYTPEGGSISVTIYVREEIHELSVVVTDSGAGIHPGDLPYIFDRYYQKDKARHSLSGGNGLGLSITKEIVELHGGRIQANNSPEGGSVFVITLPMRRQ